MELCIKQQQKERKTGKKEGREEGRDGGWIEGRREGSKKERKRNAKEVDGPSALRQTCWHCFEVIWQLPYDNC